MRRLPLLVSIVLLVLAGIWIYFRFFPSDESVIRKRLNHAAELAAIHPNEGNLQKIAAVRSLADLCTDDILLVLQGQGVNQNIHGRDQLVEALAAVRATLTSLDIKLSDIGVTVDPQHGMATSQFIARARVENNPDEFVQEITILWKQVEGVWKIHHVEPLSSLSL